MSIKKYKLGDVCNIFSGNTPSKRNSLFWENGNINWLTSSELNFNISTSKSMINSKYANYCLSPKHSTLIALVGSTIGKIGFLKKEMAINQNIASISIKDEYKNILNEKYLFYLILTLKNKILSMSSGSAQSSLSTSDLKKIKIFVTNLEEQQQIIDIIEPFESMKLNLESSLNKINLFIDKINQKSSAVGKMKDLNIEFQKGKNINSNLLTSNITNIPFINVSAINNKINKYVLDENISPNIEHGDIVLSLDGTVGLVNNFLKGFNGYGYKVFSNDIKNYQIYYSLKNKINYEIILSNSKGSVIKHASDAKNEILLFDYSNITNIEKIYEFEISLKKKIKILDKIINLLIEKYIK